MNRALAALSLLALLPAPACASGFGWFHRQPAPVVSAYYVPGPVVVTPVVVAPVVPAPVCVVPAPPVLVSPPPLPVVPQVTAPTRIVPTPGPTSVPPMPLAPAETAPPSADPFVPVSRAAPHVGETRSVSLKPAGTAFDLYPGAASDRVSPPGRYVLTVWNLTDGPLTVRVDGRDVALGRGRSAAVETGAEFAWQVEGRSSEVGRMTGPERGATLAIRR
jgi:hypothetical protein